MLTLNKIIELFKDLSNRHQMVAHFGYGPTNQIDNITPQYPLVWLDTPSSTVVLTERTLTGSYNLSLFCLDRVDKDQINFQDILSDTDFILNTMLTSFGFSSLYRDNFVKIEEGTATKTIITYDETINNKDNVAGWQMDFTIRFPIPLNECVIPVDEDCGCDDC